MCAYQSLISKKVMQLYLSLNNALDAATMYDLHATTALKTIAKFACETD